MVDKIKIVKFDDVPSDTMPGTEPGIGCLKRIIFPHTVPAKGFSFAYGEVPPGQSLHRWHKHTGDKMNGLEVIYSEGFEELYFIIKGTGVVQWKEQNGEIKEKALSERDTILFCDGVPEHQVLNTGGENMLIAVVGCPPVKIVKDA